jgi:hypothetical protein
MLSDRKRKLMEKSIERLHTLKGNEIDDKSRERLHTSKGNEIDDKSALVCVM